MKRLSSALVCIVLITLGQAQQRPLPKFPATTFKWVDKESYADSFTSEGVTIRLIKNNGVIVAVSGYDEKDYLVCEVSVINQTDERVEVKPDDFFLTYQEKGGKFGYEYPLPPSKLASKYQSRAKWGNFFRAFAAGMSTSTSQTYESGEVRITGSDGSSARGTYSGTSTTTVRNTAALRNAAEANRRATAAANDKAQGIITNAMLANTLFPKTYSSGMVYFKRKKAQSSIVYVMIDGVGYLFRFNETN